MNWVAGVDGCRQGWQVVDVLWTTGPDGDSPLMMKARIVEDLAEVLNRRPAPERVALDMPIGLLSKGRAVSRQCDSQARKLLGPRRSSVFVPPTRAMLNASDYQEVRVLGLSAQAFRIMPKIAAIDAWIDRERQSQIIEAHPELAFAQLRGAPMAHPKRLRQGREERLEALSQIYPEFRSWVQNRRFFPAEDLLDAAVLAWTAWRALRGKALRLPSEPPRDERGLEMAIWG